MSATPTVSVSEIRTGRLLLRNARDGDREGLIELQTDPEVREYLGGPRQRRDVEHYLDAIGTANATAAPRVFVIAENECDNLLGTLALTRRSAERPGRLSAEGGELELSYLLRRNAWGRGYAFEAASAELRVAAEELPDQPVMIVTQCANERSLKLALRLGFQPVEIFEEFGAQQTLATARLYSFKGVDRD
ncbi:GNAT family N-acetyltransferase [Nocardia takedensis]|uniref:GNAT family N-acetyltransferase n=1 Tax=Nocardia takedensis TaxID=259390 RepID=UPI0005940308|nr:GNAT family N-acetyltransferase [Nocardia takedensis]